MELTPYELELVQHLPHPYTRPDPVDRTAPPAVQEMQAQKVLSWERRVEAGMMLLGEELARRAVEEHRAADQPPW